MKKISKTILISLCSIWCMSLFGSLQLNNSDVNAYTGAKNKEIIYSYDALDGVSSSERIYPYGKMIEANRYSYIQPVFSNYIATDWTNAEYLLFYADNRNHVPSTLGFCITSNKQSFTPKPGATGIVYLDDMETCEAENVKIFNNGTRNGVELPARYKGYVKVKIDSESITQFDCNVTNGVFNYSTVSMVEFKGANIYITALALSYDDDISSVLDEKTALLGRKTPSKEPMFSGKIVVDEFLYSTVISSENEYSNYMLPLNSEKFNGQQFALSSYKDWKNVSYSLFYIDNKNQSKIKLKVNLNTNGKLININSGSVVFLDDLKKIEEITVDENGLFEIAGNFKGYVKIPFNNKTFTVDKAELVNSLNVYANVENSVYLDNVSVAFDNDINYVFNGLFENRPFTDFEKEGISNNVYVMPNFYEIHKGNSYFDGKFGINEAHSSKGNIGKVEYSERLDSMTVTHKSGASGITMWGQNNPYLDTDWSDAKYVLIKIKNELNTADKLCIVMARTNTYVNNGAIYYLKDGASGKTDFYLTSSGGYVTIPSEFDGYLLIPCQSFGTNFNWANMPRISFMFSSTAGKLTFGIIGKAISDKVLSSNYALTIIDSSLYFEVPDPIPYPSYPERTPTEPEKATQGNGCTSNIKAGSIYGFILLSVFGGALIKKKKV